MNSAKKTFSLYFTTLWIIFSVSATTITPSPILDAADNTTTNYTENSRLFDNNKVSISVASGCFSSDTLITLANQQQIPIGQLRPAHHLLTIDGTTIVNTEMMMMLDQNHLSSAMFHTILTASGHKLSLTGLHLIAVLTKDSQLKYKAAKDVREGHILRVVTNETVHSSVVKSVMMEVKRGFYAPLTMAGTLLVNGIAASCFANVENHEMAQLALSPMRWYYGISRWLSIEKPFGDEKGEGIHQIPQMLYELAQSIYPSALRSA